MNPNEVAYRVYLNLENLSDHDRTIRNLEPFINSLREHGIEYKHGNYDEDLVVYLKSEDKPNSPIIAGKILAYLERALEIIGVEGKCFVKTKTAGYGNVEVPFEYVDRMLGVKKGTARQLSRGVMDLIIKYLPNRTLSKDEIIDIWNFTKFRALIPRGYGEIPYKEVEKVYEAVGLKDKGTNGHSLPLKVNDKDDASMVAVYDSDFSYADIGTMENEGKRVFLLQESIVSNEMKNKGNEKFGFFPWEPWSKEEKKVKESYERGKTEFRLFECKTIRAITCRLSEGYLKRYNSPWTLPGNI